MSNKKSFTIILPLMGVTESEIKCILSRLTLDLRPEDIQVFEHNKIYLCDGCQKQRRDVQSCGRDSDGTPDAPDLCFLCRKENERGRVYSIELGRYIPSCYY